MKRLIGIILLILISFTGFCQSWMADSVFHEVFEVPGGVDSMITSQHAVPFANDWTLNSRLHSQGTMCDSCQVKPAKTVTLTSIPFCTGGYDTVVLSFSHICKIDLFDIARVEYSINNGMVWIPLGPAQYVGNAIFNGTFGAGSYGTWQPSNNSATPTNGWWKTEYFNMTSLVANHNTVMIRFVLIDAGPVGANNAKGWYVDNVNVWAYVEYGMPPVIFPVEMPTGIVESTGPFNVKAIVRDAEGVGSVDLSYSINNLAPVTINMPLIQGDTFGAFIPIVADSSYIQYSISAVDVSTVPMQSTFPATGVKEFLALQTTALSYIEAFDQHNLWTSYNYGATKWELGVPSFGQTQGAHSNPNAWDINLTSAYTSNSYSVLESPRFYLNQAMNVKLAAWLNYNTESIQDGTTLEYSLDDINWQTLGSVNDTLAKNWYNNNISSVYNRPGWTGNSNGWIRTAYRLSFLNNMSTHIRFRYVFTSGNLNNLDGISLDDFSLQFPSNQEVAVVEMISPNDGCGLNLENVTVIISNVGQQPISNFPISYKVNNSPIVTENCMLTLQPGSSYNYTFITPVDLSQSSSGTIYTIQCWADLIGDPDHTDDTINKIIYPWVTPPPQVSNVIIPYGTSATLTAISNLPVRWYDQAVGGILLAQGPVYITLILYGQMVFYAEAVQGNCLSSRSPDTVFVTSPFPWDAGLFRFLMPLSATNLSDTEQVKVKFKNLGINTIQTITMNYQINNGNVVSEVLNCNVPQGDSLMYVFNQTADLSMIATYNFKLWTSLVGDGNYSNDTIHQTVVHHLYPYPFSGATSTDNADIGNFSFGELSNGNVSSTTNNPDANHTYTDFTQSVQAVNVSRGLSYPVNITSIFSGGASNCCVKVFIDWNYDGVLDPATETAFEAGPGKTAFNGYISVPMNAHTLYTLMRIVLVQGVALNDVMPSGTYTYGETEDYLVYIYPNFPQDASVTQILEPGDTAILNTLVHCKLNIKNTGDIPLYQVPLAVSFNLAQDCNYTWEGLLKPDSSAIADWTLGVINDANYNFWAFTKLPGDHQGNNDTLHKPVAVVGIDDPPYNDLKFSLSPNPCDQYLSVEVNLPGNGSCELLLQNIQGQTIRKFFINEQKLKILTSELPDGLYLLTLKSGNLKYSRKVNVIH